MIISHTLSWITRASILTLLLLQRGHYVSANGQFNLITATGQRLATHSTVRTSRSCIECAVLCVAKLGDASPCLAFQCDGVSGMTCQLYVDDATKDPLIGVDLYWLQLTDIFHSLTFDGQRVSIYFSSIKKQYIEARDHCTEMGGYLLDLDKMADYEAIRFVTRDYPTAWVFFGATDEAQEDVWLKTKDGTPCNEAIWNWAHGEPSNGGGSEHCVLVDMRTMKVNDVGSWYSLHYLCERDV